jgi:hypothetical protein
MRAATCLLLLAAASMTAYGYDPRLPSMLQFVVYTAGGDVPTPSLSYTNGIIARYRAHDLAAHYAEGQTVTNWFDISGNGRHALQVGKGHQVLRLSGIGDRASVEMTNAIFRTLNFGITNSTPISMLLVFRADQIASATPIIDSLSDQRFTFYSDLTTWRMRLNANGHVGTSDTDAHWVLLQYHQATSTVYSAMWQDGVLISAGVNAGGSTGLQGLTIGARANNTTIFKGDISEVVVFDHDVVAAGGEPPISEYVETFYGEFPQ